MQQLGLMSREFLGDLSTLRDVFDGAAEHHDFPLLISEWNRRFADPAYDPVVTNDTVLLGVFACTGASPPRVGNTLSVLGMDGGEPQATRIVKILAAHAINPLEGL